MLLPVPCTGVRVWGKTYVRMKTMYSRALMQAIPLGLAKFRINRVTMKRRKNKSTCGRIRLQRTDLAEVSKRASGIDKDTRAGLLWSQSHQVKVSKSPLHTMLGTEIDTPPPFSSSLCSACFSPGSPGLELSYL